MKQTFIFRTEFAIPCLSASGKTLAGEDPPKPGKINKSQSGEIL